MENQVDISNVNTFIHLLVEKFFTLQHFRLNSKFWTALITPSRVQQQKCFPLEDIVELDNKEIPPKSEKTRHTGEGE